MGRGESVSVNESARLHSCPARHFSGRGLQRGKTVWSSYVLELGHLRIFIGGDSGYDGQFKIIGEKFGPFDMAILDCAQYGADWPLIHMKPEETVKAATDLKAKSLLPVHWGKFALSYHPWTEPVERLLKASASTSLQVVTPMIGEILIIGAAPTYNHWWRI